MNDPSLYLFTLTRVLHVGTAIVLVGGSVFLRYVLMPSASETLPDDVHAQLRSRIMSRWKWFVHAGIVLLLLTGFVNYFRQMGVIRASGSKDSIYHMIVGTKILLAFGIFFIASALVGRSPAFEGLRKNARLWITVNILLALVIVILSGYLRVRPPVTPS